MPSVLSEGETDAETAQGAGNEDEWRNGPGNPDYDCASDPSFTRAELLGVPYFYATDDNREIFETCAARVFELIPADERAAIQSLLKEIRFVHNVLECASGPATGLATGGGVVAIYCVGCRDEQSANFLIAHELRHIWQYATGFDSVEPSEMQALYLTNAWKRQRLEADADAAAKRLGFSSVSLATHLDVHFLPFDQQFRSFARSWTCMTAEQRSEFVEQAMAIRLASFTG